jgi:hypothetical protein
MTDTTMTANGENKQCTKKWPISVRVSTAIKMFVQSDKRCVNCRHGLIARPARSLLTAVAAGDCCAEESTTRNYTHVLQYGAITCGWKSNTPLLCKASRIRVMHVIFPRSDGGQVTKRSLSSNCALNASAACTDRVVSVCGLGHTKVESLVLLGRFGFSLKLDAVPTDYSFKSCMLLVRYYIPQTALLMSVQKGQNKYSFLHTFSTVFSGVTILRLSVLDPLTYCYFPANTKTIKTKTKQNKDKENKDKQNINNQLHKQCIINVNYSWDLEALEEMHSCVSTASNSCISSLSTPFACRVSFPSWLDQ